MATEPKVVEIDMLGQVCPSTLLTALREMNAHRDELRRGGVELLFRSDNRACTRTIPESAANMGYDAEVRKLEGNYLIRISARRRDDLR